MRKDKKNEPPRLFKVSHQILCITGINFDNKSLVGYVDLTVWPAGPDLTEIRLNSKQCIIYRVIIDKKWNSDYTYYDPTLNICQGNSVKRNIDYFQKCLRSALSAVDPDQGNGELIVRLPTEILPTVSALGSFQVCIEFALQEPKGGVHFVVPDLPGCMAERSAHMFTYGVENFSRMWFPCVDSFSEPCTWKIEVTVDRDMTAVSCGDLVSVEYTEDMTEKTYHYFLSSPVAAPNIALAVGFFEILVDPKMHEVTHFCPAKLMPVLKHTTSYIHQAFEFYEELMSSRYPYAYYKQVFVDEAYFEVATYSTMSILSVNLLHPPNIIDQTMASRQLMATAVAQQFFGSFIAMESWSDAWLTKGITGYLSYLFCKRTFGNNEYRNWVMRDLQEVSEYEQQVGYVILDPSKRDSNHSFSTQSPHTLSPRYSEIFNKKARLVMRMLEIRIGTELLLQVLNKLLSLAYNSSQQPFGFSAWINMLLSTSSFLKIIYTVTGKDIEPFISLWVYQGGCARFTGSFVFNRKRNVVELDIKQDLSAPGNLKYVGTLNVTIQELDGSFNHQFKIEENKTKFEITCHSKSRRNKKKKIPLVTGEEVDMDLSAMDVDSPVLWLRLDPDMHLLRTVSFEQPDYMWQYQLKFERCIVAQFEAIEALGKFPTAASRLALTDTIENEECYYRVRQDACYCLAKIANLMVGTWTGPPAMITIFRKMFGSHSCPFIIKQNNFSNFHHYYLLKTMPQAMARLRDSHNLCLTEITKFLLDLFKYNDNSRNKWSDNYFRAALVEALAASITPAVTNVSLITGQVVTAETLSADTRLLVEEVVRCLNLEKLMPCYKFTVTVSCLYTIRTLQKLGHLPNESDFFKDYTQPGIFRDVRVAALTCLVDFIRGDITGGHLKWILDFMEKERDPYLRHHAITCLTQSPPFRPTERSPLNSKALVEQLWDNMCHMSHDCRLRCSLADLYFTLYGRQRPTCLPAPEHVVVESNLPSLLPAHLGHSTGSVIWTPELCGLFSPPMSQTNTNGEILSPSTVKINLDMAANDSMELGAADGSLLTEESVVTHEELMMTEVTVAEDSDMEDDVKPELDPDTITTSVQRTTSFYSRQDSVSHLSEESLSPASSPAKGHPDDVIVSLDNIIKTDPTFPVNIFSTSSSPGTSSYPGNPFYPYPPFYTGPPAIEPESAPSTPSASVWDESEHPSAVSPQQGQTTEDRSPLAVHEDEDRSVKEEIIFLDSSAAESPSLPLSSPSPQASPSTSHKPDISLPLPPLPSSTSAWTIDVKLEPEVEPSSPVVHPSSPVVQPSSALSSPEVQPSPPPAVKPSPPPSPPMVQTSSPPSSPLVQTLPPEMQPSPPPVIQPSSPPVVQPSPPPVVQRSPSPLTQHPPRLEPSLSVTQTLPPYKRKLSWSSSQDYPSPDTQTHKTVPPLIFSTSAISAAAGTSTSSSLPSLKTTFNLSAAVAAHEARERESHHKSKKKKKKHKHKHKHKHRHDRGESSEHPRERLVLDMSELSRASRESPSVRTVESLDEQTSSE